MDILHKLNPNTHEFHLFYHKCRDKDIPVYKCEITGAIALEYVHTTMYEDIKDFSYWTASDVETAKKKCQRDDSRRQEYITKIKPDTWLDVGSGVGGIFKGMNYNAESVEPMPQCRSAIPVKSYKACDEIPNDKLYDLITSFHVIEHLPDPLGVLKNMKTHLKVNGTCIIEVPHAKDFLLEYLDLESFKDFTLWSQHLILHTEFTLRRLLELAGFKDIKIEYIQRYPLSNHLYWLRHGKPGGHNKWPELNVPAYDQMLINMKMSDTLLAFAK